MGRPTPSLTDLLGGAHQQELVVHLLDSVITTRGPQFGGCTHIFVSSALAAKFTLPVQAMNCRPAHIDRARLLAGVAAADHVPDLGGIVRSLGGAGGTRGVAPIWRRLSQLRGESAAFLPAPSAPASRATALMQCSRE